MNNVYINGFYLIKNSEGLLEISYDFPGGSSRNRFVLDSLGMYKLMRREEERDEWFIFWSAPYNDCDLYGRCGPFGICSVSSSRSSSCSCLRGFEPKNVEWSRGNWSGGCVRTTPLECEKNGSGKGDWFMKVEGVKVPDLADSLGGGSLEECEEKCRKNCSCVAYAYDSGMGCMFWRGDLIDIQRLSSGGVDIYIRLGMLLIFYLQDWRLFG